MSATLSQDVRVVSTWLQCAGPAEPVAEHGEQQASHLSGQRLAQHLPTAVDDSYAGVIAAALNAQDKLVSGCCRESALLENSYRTPQLQVAGYLLTCTAAP